MSDIKSIYPKAEKGDDYTSRCIEKLKKDHDFDIKKTILATSVCSDEIIRSATNFRDYVSLNMPFQLGGLAGFPFTGLTGFGAFAAHVPDDGCAIILYGPHIGISGNKVLGKVVRTGQQLETTCCGALVGAVNTFKSGEASEPDPEYDYQQWKLTVQLKPEKDHILNNDNPLISATDVMFHRISQRIKILLKKSKDLFKGNKVALMGGIIINTDYGVPDWFEEREFEVHEF
ncbi:hypothetical protein BH23BAC3_BH23BAC3_16180 [soil metagenome]